MAAGLGGYGINEKGRGALAVSSGRENMYNLISYAMQSKESLIYDFIAENGIATENEIALVTSIAGWGVDQLNGIIYARTGYHDAKQCYNCEPENYNLSDALKSFYGIDVEGEED